MWGALFRRELSGGLVDAAVATAFGLALIIVWKAWMGSADEGTLVAFLCLALAAGARAFSEGSRRDRASRLYTLPVPRIALWTSILGGRFAAFLLSVAALLFTRPIILWEGLAGVLPVWIAGLLPVVFVAGTCLSLVVERLWVRSLFAVPLAFFIIQAVTLARIVQPAQYPWPAAFGMLLCELALFLWFSWRCFQRGDLESSRWRLGRQGLLAAAMISCLLFVGACTLGPAWIGGAHAWTHDPTPLQRGLELRVASPRTVSPGGRYLAVVENLRSRPGISRVSIVDTSTGRLVGQRKFLGLRWASWSDREPILHVVVEQSLGDLGALPGSAKAWIRLAPNGVRLSTHRLGTFLGAAAALDGTHILLERIGEKDRILRLGDDGHLRVVAEAPSVDTWQVFSLRGQGVVVTRRELTASALFRIWHLQGRSTRELVSREEPRILSDLVPGGVFGNDVHHQLAEIFGIPWTEVGNGKPIAGFFLFPFPEGVWVIAPAPIPPVAFSLRLDHGLFSLWARRLGSPRWRLLSKDLSGDEAVQAALMRLRRVDLDLDRVVAADRPAVSMPDEIALYLPTGSRGSPAELYDGSLDREVRVPGCHNIYAHASSLELISASSSAALLIRLRCGDPVLFTWTPHRLPSREWHSFSYRPGSGSVTEIPVLAAPGEDGQPMLLAYLEGQTAIWRLETSGAWMVVRDGKTRQLWPL